jgi:hypothetical protein
MAHPKKVRPLEVCLDISQLVLRFLVLGAKELNLRITFGITVSLPLCAPQRLVRPAPRRRFQVLVLDRKLCIVPDKKHFIPLKRKRMILTKLNTKERRASEE